MKRVDIKQTLADLADEEKLHIAVRLPGKVTETWLVPNDIRIGYDSSHWGFNVQTEHNRERRGDMGLHIAWKWEPVMAYDSNAFSADDVHAGGWGEGEHLRSVQLNKVAAITATDAPAIAPAADTPVPLTEPEPDGSPLFWEYINDRSWTRRAFAASMTNLSPRQLRFPLNDPIEEVRRAAAANPLLKGEDLDIALHDKSVWVKASAAANPSANETQINMALLAGPTERAAAAGNISANTKQIAIALVDEDWKVRVAAVGNPNITDAQLTEALTDEHPAVCKYATQILAQRQLASAA